MDDYFLVFSLVSQIPIMILYQEGPEKKGLGNLCFSGSPPCFLPSGNLGPRFPDPKTPKEISPWVFVAKPSFAPASVPTRESGRGLNGKWYFSTRQKTLFVPCRLIIFNQTPGQYFFGNLFEWTATHLWQIWIEPTGKIWIEPEKFESNGPNVYWNPNREKLLWWQICHKFDRPKFLVSINWNQPEFCLSTGGESRRHRGGTYL